MRKNPFIKYFFLIDFSYAILKNDYLTERDNGGVTMGVRIIILPIIGALIGWVTNVLAIRLIFRPINKIHIPIIGLNIQGLIPKRKVEIAKSIGETVEKELVSIEDIIKNMANNLDKNHIIDLVKLKIQKVFFQKIPGFLPHSIKNLIIVYIEENISKEIEPTLNEIIEDLIIKTTNTIKIGDIVEEKINKFDLIKLENLIINITKRELKQIEYLGGVIGFFIGIFQSIIVLVL